MMCRRAYDTQDLRHVHTKHTLLFPGRTQYTLMRHGAQEKIYTSD